MSYSTPNSSTNSMTEDVVRATIDRDAQDAQATVAVAFVDGLEVGRFRAAGVAPGGPEVDQEGVAAVVGEGDRGAVVEGGGGEVGGGVAAAQGGRLGGDAGREEQGGQGEGAGGRSPSTEEQHGAEAPQEETT